MFRTSNQFRPAFHTVVRGVLDAPCSAVVLDVMRMAVPSWANPCIARSQRHARAHLRDYIHERNKGIII